MTRWGRFTLVLAVVLALAGAGAVAADETSPEAPAAAATYASGVGAVASATYPEGTLHVGAALGQETDRTYLRFELGSVPDGADVSGVTITIPVDPDAGTASPETAVMLACAVPAGFDAEASEPPGVDCEGAPEATFVAGEAPSFSIALAAPQVGDVVDVALVPGGGDTWHVGFDGPEGEDPPTAVASYEAPVRPTTTVASRPVPSPAPPSSGPTGVGPIAMPPLTVPPPSSTGSAIADEAAVSTPTAVAAIPTVSAGGFRYRAVFALPLALLVIVAVAGDGLTRPVRLREDAP